ncbi:type III restriction enzyme, res subunit, partial [Chlamydia psittaci C6/98]
RLPIRLFPR